MGNHQSPRTSLLQRVKTKRMVVVTAATGAVLVAGGTAGAAVVSDLGGDPQAATNNVGLPDARTAAPTTPSASASTDAQQRKQAEQQREQATQNASQSFDGSAAPEKKEQPRPDTSDSGTDSSSDSGGESGLSPTGEGGSCEASMYSEPQPTASGETFDPSAMTAAHKTLPMDTRVRVTNPDNGKSVTVRINDRGPYVSGRCLDLSTASFEKIASSSAGVVDVEWQVVS